MFMSLLHFSRRTLPLSSFIVPEITDQGEFRVITAMKPHPTISTSDFSLAEWGRNEIDIAEIEMPG